MNTTSLAVTRGRLLPFQMFLTNEQKPNPRLILKSGHRTRRQIPQGCLWFGILFLALMCV